MVRDDKVYLNDILERITRIDKALKIEDYEVKMDAILYNITIIGEAVSSLSQELKAKFNHIPWQTIKATRNIIIHNYLGIDDKVIWNIVNHSIPELKADIKKIILSIK